MQRIFKEIKSVSNVIKNFLRFIVWLWWREIDYYRIKPREALFFLTYRCSSRCKMCQMWKRSEDYQEMDLKSWKKTVDMVAKLKVKVIYLFGGDVLLKKEILIPLAKYIVQKGIHCDITTNGNLLNKEIAEQLIKTGVNNIGTSIDAVGDAHDDIRRVKGMFNRATQGIKDMFLVRGNSNRPTISIYCTISKLNIDIFDKVLPYALDLCADALHFEYYGEFSPEKIQDSKVDGITSNPYYERQDGSLLLNERQAHYLKTKVRELERKAKGRIYLDTENIDCLSVRDLVEGRFQYKRCYLVRYHINVDPSGNVIPCLFFQNYHLGNIRNTPVNKIWGNEKHKIFLKSIRNKEVKICKNCIEGVQRNPTVSQALKRKIIDNARRLKRNI